MQDDCSSNVDKTTTASECSASSKPRRTVSNCDHPASGNRKATWDSAHGKSSTESWLKLYTLKLVSVFDHPYI
jgi:hypothetical protein